ncbi:DUF2586 family protein [Kordia sp. TARA_039_SRF]|nr:DUF2586 family protein [Kordia sp. TARA_039_SRF]
MGFVGVNVNQLQGGLGRTTPNTDGVFLLIINNAVATPYLPIRVSKELLTLNNAEDLGITASYDDNNSILAHYHIDEFFRIAPEGNLHIVLDDGTMTDDKLKSLLRTEETIKGFGVVRNSEDPLADFTTHVLYYQKIIDDLSEENREIDFFLLEGNEFTANGLISDYQDVREIGAENAGIVISQDTLIRPLNSVSEKHACIGAALGALAVRTISENLGSVDIQNKPEAFKGTNDYPLTDETRSRFQSACLQDGKDFNSLSKNEIKALNDKGYIFVGKFNGYANFFFNDSHTCVSRSSDYSRIENNRVWNKAARLIRKTLLPRVKSNISTDPATGFIANNAAKELEELVLDVLKKEMISSGDISGAGINIPTNQSLFDDVPLKVTAEIIMNQIIHAIEVDLGLTDKLI